jgi:hypothetical protein
MLMSPKVGTHSHFKLVHIFRTGRLTVPLQVADLVETLYNSIERNHAEHGRDGYYFVAHGEIEFEKVTEIAEKRAGGRRAFTETELQKYFSSVSVYALVSWDSADLAIFD